MPPLARLRRCAALLLLLAAARPGIAAPPECDALLHAVARETAAAGVENASTFPLGNDPFLRTTRFLQALRLRVDGRAAWEAWCDLTWAVSADAARTRVAVLPAAAAARLSAGAGRETLLERILECGRAETRALARAGFLAGSAAAAAEVPSEYRTLRRVAGLYPLWVPPVAAAVANYRREVRRIYALPLEQRTRGRLAVFAAAPSAAAGDAAEVRRILAPRTALAVPWPTPAELARLARLYAPVIEQEVTVPDDLPGALAWEGDLPVVRPGRLEVYYYADHALVRGRTLLQLDYVLWYPGRPRRHLLDLEAGRLHGLTLRLTLDPEGIPIMADVIHNCGCYHFLFPRAGAWGAVRRHGPGEGPTVPQNLPDLPAAAGPVVRVGTVRHWVVGIRAPARPPRHARSYALVPYARLEALPRAGGRAESVFTPRGLVKGGTRRAERWFLFGIGIPEIGSMRQRGHHATALLGRRMFDDPRLLERLFSVPETPSFR